MTAAGAFRYRTVIVAVLLLASMVGGSRAPLARAGNREMVEQRTEELGEINRQAVSQIPEELPEDGVIELEAEVVGGGTEPTVEIKDYSIRRGQIPRSNQTGNEAAKARGSIPRYDPNRH